MPSLTVQISRFVDEHQPGFVECVLIDVHGQSHIFIEKVPIVTTESLCSTSSYPCLGSIDCDVESEWQDETGHSVSRVNTERPWGVESISGTSSFEVSSSQLVHQ